MTKINSVFSAMRRSPYQTFLAILMTTITFFMISLFSLVVLGANQMLRYFESRPQVTAFFKDDATTAQIDALKANLSSTTSLDSAKYISKEDALNIYREQNHDNPLLLEMVTADILPASLEVSTSNVKDLELVATIMQNDLSVEEVVFQKDVIDTLKKWLGGVRLAGAALTLLLTLVSLSTIIVIIGLKFRNKKTEVYTLSLLGATSWYIRSPYVFEATLYSVVGGIVGWGVSYVTLLYLTPNLIGFFGEIPLLPVSPLIMLSVLGIELLLGIVLGAVSSLLATRRYVR